MKLRLILLGFMVSGLIACGRSKQTDLYILNPITYSPKIYAHYNGLKLGLDNLSIPAYLSKAAIPVFHTPNQATLYESHEWGEDLEKNTKRVLTANLALLLPKSLVEYAPWANTFKPHYTLDVFIQQWMVSVRGESKLQANYIISDAWHPVYQKNITFYQRVPQVNPQTIVVSMNANLTRLSYEIAKSFRLLYRH